MADNTEKRPTIAEKQAIADSIERLKNAGLLDYKVVGKDEDGFPIYKMTKVVNIIKSI